jgi:hypothetical protein
VPLGVKNHGQGLGHGGIRTTGVLPGPLDPLAPVRAEATIEQRPVVVGQGDQAAARAQHVVQPRRHRGRGPLLAAAHFAQVARVIVRPPRELVKGHAALSQQPPQLGAKVRHRLCHPP